MASGSLQRGGILGGDAPDVTLVAVTAPVTFRAFAPAVPDGLVLALVVGASEGEAVLRPDDRVRPVRAGLLKHARDERPLLAAHAHVERAVHVLDQVARPAAAERLPLGGRHRVVRDLPLARAALLPAVVPIRDVVRRVREGHGGRLSGQHTRHDRRVRAIPAEQPVIAQQPHVTGLRPRRRLARLLDRLVEVERLRALASVAHVQRLQELRHLVLAEAGEREVYALDRLEISEQTRQQLLVPRAGDLVEREVQ